MKVIKAEISEEDMSLGIAITAIWFGGDYGGDIGPDSRVLTRAKEIAECVAFTVCLARTNQFPNVTTPTHFEIERQKKDEH